MSRSDPTVDERNGRCELVSRLQSGSDRVIDGRNSRPELDYQLRSRSHPTIKSHYIEHRFCADHKSYGTTSVDSDEMVRHGMEKNRLKGSIKRLKSLRKSRDGGSAYTQRRYSGAPNLEEEEEEEEEEGVLK